MACSHHIANGKGHNGNGECKNGFPVTSGCWATGKLGELMGPRVHCLDEEWCGWAYSQTGGKPKVNES